MALEEPVRTGIARVLVNLSRAMSDLAPGRLVPVGLAEQHWRRATEHGEELALSRPAGHLPAAGAPVLLGVSITAPASLPDWEQAITAFRRDGGRYAQVVHDLLPEQLPDFFTSGLRTQFGEWLRIVLEQADVVLANSHSTLTDLQHYAQQHGLDGPRRELVFHPGVSQDTVPAHRVACQHPVILAVGTVEPRKGYQVLADAAAEVWAQRPDVEFVVVGGPGWGHCDVGERLAALDLSDFPFRWLRHASDAELAAQYARAHVLVQASYGEGFGLPVVEASAAGVRVLARDIGVFREVLGQQGAFFSHDAALGERILEVLGSAEAVPAAAPPTWGEAATAILKTIDEISDPDTAT